MRKLFISILIVILLGIISIYFFIPNGISFSENVVVNASREGIVRKLFSERDVKWLSANMQKGPSGENWEYNNSSYFFSKETIGLVTIRNQNLLANTIVLPVSKTNDSTQIFWSGLIPTSYNPMKRLHLFFAAKKLRNDIDALLQKMQSYFSKIENVYGYSIKHSLVKDSLLISTLGISKNYPSTDFVYQLIDRLRKYVSKNGAKETGAPMLNVSTNDSISYLVKVAIPVNQKLPSSNNIVFKQMLGNGNILMVDIKGGPETIKHAFYQIQNYLLDYHEVAPAIPFESLITDRSKEPDTSKWITRIYYPVM